MTENTDTPTNKRNILVRGLYMLLMFFMLHVLGTVVFVITVMQFVLALLSDTPNDRLIAFGRNLGRYLQQIVLFLTFASEAIPFPFSDWPAGE